MKVELIVLSFPAVLLAGLLFGRWVLSKRAEKKNIEERLNKYIARRN
jgi:uncharacterized protein YneF (UPF0154 family)